MCSLLVTVQTGSRTELYDGSPSLQATTTATDPKASSQSSKSSHGRRLAIPPPTWKWPSTTLSWCNTLGLRAHAPMTPLGTASRSSNTLDTLGNFHVASRRTFRPTASSLPRKTRPLTDIVAAIWETLMTSRQVTWVGHAGDSGPATQLHP